MKFSIRAAAAAAATIFAAATAGFSTPGFAFEMPATIVDGGTPSISTLNAADYQKVPTPETPVVPASLTPDQNRQPDQAETDIDYDSLDAAVYAQSIPSEMDREMRCLAIGIYFESKGEPLSGQLAVADVILNRAQSGRFPDSVCSVLTQHSQFSFVHRGRLPTPRVDSDAWRTAVAVAKVASGDLWDSPVPQALFFHTRYVTPHWRLAKVGTIGNHVFYR